MLPLHGYAKSLANTFVVFLNNNFEPINDD